MQVASRRHFFTPLWTDEFDDGAIIPVFVLPRFWTALFSLVEEPGVPAGPKLLPVVPWLLALLAFASGAPPVPFTVAPLLRVVPAPDEEPPVEVAGDVPPTEVPVDDPPAEPPLEAPPPPAPKAAEAKPDKTRLLRTMAVVSFMIRHPLCPSTNFRQTRLVPREQLLTDPSVFELKIFGMNKPPSPELNGNNQTHDLWRQSPRVNNIGRQGVMLSVRNGRFASKLEGSQGCVALRRARSHRAPSKR